MVDGKICPVVESNGSGNYKQNHQMVITLRERKRKKRRDWRGWDEQKERKKAKNERREKDKEVLMAFCFIIYGSPGWMLSEAEILLHKFKSSD
jgi:hypothetical protein